VLSLAVFGLAVQGLSGLETTRLTGALVTGGWTWFNLEVLRFSLMLLVLVLICLELVIWFSLCELAERRAVAPG
jgi:hypothetical protein